jgi:hypothetical protein
MDAVRCALHRAFRRYWARWCGGITSFVIDRVTIAHPMRQAAGWPLVHAMQFPATLLGCGLEELGASLARDGFRGVLAPFRPERIAQPGQS